MPGDVIEWIDADGNAYDLTAPSSPLRVLRGMRGRFMPPIERIVDVVPGQPGARLRQVRHDIREVVVPIRINTSDEATLRDTLRVWAQRLDPLRGAGQLRVTGPDGTPRVLSVRYDGGLEIDESDGFHPAGWQHAVLVFVAHDPYWRDPADTVNGPYSITSAPATFFPFFPLRLTASEGTIDFTIDNLGDVDTWPVWTIVGPCTDIYLRRLTSSGFDIEIQSFPPTTTAVLRITTTLLADETITIDTRPGVKTVTRNDGTNLFAAIDPTQSALWPLRPGSNSVRVELGGATTKTTITVNYQNRWLVT